MNAQQLKNAILQEAIEGRLVPQDPNDEPASALLERILKEKEELVKAGKLKKKDLEEIPISEDEKPFDIPESWEWCRICDISQSYIGLTYKPTDVKETGTIVLRSSNIQNGKLVLDDIVRVSTPITDKLWVEVNDIIICARNGSKKLVGKSAIIDEINEPMTFGAFMAICKTPLYKYVYTFLQSDLFYAQLREVSGTTTINQLTQNNFNKFIIPIPPLAEQKRIVAKIEELMPKVEEYGKAQEKLNKLNEELPERLKKSILQEAIEGRLVPQDPNDEPASALLAKIREEKKQLVKEGKLKKKDLEEKPISENEIPFEIPESWEWVRFGDLVATSTGKTPARGDAVYWSSNDYPWVSISDMKQGGIIETTKEFVSQKAADDYFHGQISSKGTLIMSFKLTVGRTSILGIDAYHNEAIISIKMYADNMHYTRDYLSYILPIIANSGDSKDAIKGKTLNSKSIYNLFIPLPPLAEQKRIVAKIEQLMKEIDKLKV